MKKVFIRESSLEDIKNSELLPPFLFKMVKYHKTSLGDNEAFPKVGEYPFDYSILKKRFGIVSFSLKSLARLDGEINDVDEESLLNYLGSLVRKCKEYETPIKDTLENIAENALNRLFAIPDGTINVTATLTDKITFKHSPRITPESEEMLKYSFKDIADIEFSDKAVEKRRFINSLIQGGSRRMLDTALIGEDIAFNDINKINPELIPLYKKIMIINDYLLFTKKEELDDKNPMQGAYVETHLGADGERSTIEAQGIIFPLLLQELIKGVFEVFSAHGLPSDKKKAMYVIKKADFLLAEPWDMRFGVGLWDEIFGDIHDSNIIPYVFTKLIELPTDEFNSSVREILASTETGNRILNDLVNAAQYDSDYQEFTNKINKKNIDKSVIADSYFSAAELTGLELDDDNDNVIEEGDGDGIDYIELIKSATVDNIDFNEGKITNNGGEQLILTIDGTEIPSEYVDMVVFFMGNKFNGKPFKSLNLHIILAEEIQGLGLGTKIYTKMVYEFGSLYSWGETRTNDEHIGKIYQKLNNDPNITVTTIPNENGRVDYLAVLDGYNIFEEKYKNGELITEGWSKDKQVIINRVYNVLKNNIIDNDMYRVANLEHKIAEKYFHGQMSGSAKIRRYEPMIANILTKDLGYPNNPTIEEEELFLKNVVEYIWNFEVREGKQPLATCKYDPNGVVLDDFDTIVSKYKPLLDELKKSGIRTDGRVFGESDYEIIPIDNFEEANKYGNYSNPELPLCYTQGRGTWEDFTHDGRYKCFLCLNKNTWEKWGKGQKPENNENTPYDEYGLSMIWVFIDPKGRISNSNTRWNHNMEAKIPKMGYGGTGVDNCFNVESLENVLNMTFENAFHVKPEEVEEKLKIVLELIEKINNGETTYSEAFNTNNLRWLDETQKLSESLLCIILKNTDANLIRKNENGKFELLFPDFWLEDCYLYGGDNFVKIGYKNSFNLLDLNGNFVISKNIWFNHIGSVAVNFEGESIRMLRVKCGNRMNYYIPGKGLLTDDWPMHIGIYSNGEDGDLIYCIRDNGTFEIFDEKTYNFIPLTSIIEQYGGKEDLLPERLRKAINFRFGGCEVRFGQYKNMIDENGKLLSNCWFDDIYGYNNGIMVVVLNGRQNLIREDGTFVFNKPYCDWFEGITLNSRDSIIVERGSKQNIADLEGNLVFKDYNINEWPSEIEKMQLGNGNFIYQLIDYNDNGDYKFNALDKNFNLLWKQPKSKWFDFMRYGGGYFAVTIEFGNGGRKSNFLSPETGALMFDKPIEEWFDAVSPFEENHLLTTVQKDRRLNFINREGNLLDPDWTLVSGDTFSSLGFTIVTREDKLKNIVDLEKGIFESEEWFVRIERLGYNNLHECITADYRRFIYNPKEGELKELTSNFASHDFETTPYGNSLKDYAFEHFGNDATELIPDKLYRIQDFTYDDYVKLSNLLGLVDGKPRFLLPKWVETVYKPVGNACVCRIAEKVRNIFNLATLQYIFDKSIQYTEIDREYGVIKIEDNDHANLVDGNCNLLLKNWPAKISEYYQDGGRIPDGYLRTTYDDGKENLYHIPSHGFVSKTTYDCIKILRYNESGLNQMVAVGIKSDNSPYAFNFNILNKNSEPAFNDWANIVTPIENEGYAFMVWQNEKEAYCNLGNVNTGELISDKPIFPSENGTFKFKIEKNGKYNFLKSLFSIKLILPQWVDSVTDFDENGKAIAVINGEEYILDSNTGGIHRKDGNEFMLNNREEGVQ